jgi:membrane peptidoglycan carboxypeptidase
VAFVGYTPRYAASVMLLNPKQNQDLGGYGGRLAAPIWHDAMEPILSPQPAVPFPPPGISLAPPPPPPPPPPAPRRPAPERRQPHPSQTHPPEQPPAERSPSPSREPDTGA